MLIKNAKRTDTGDWEFGLMSTEDEVSFLVNFAVIHLIQTGIIKIQSDIEVQEIDLQQVVVGEGGLH